MENKPWDTLSRIQSKCMSIDLERLERTVRVASPSAQRLSMNMGVGGWG